MYCIIYYVFIKIDYSDRIYFIKMSSQNIKHIMYIHVDNDPELLALYKDKASQHNRQCKTNNFPDSGFDLFCPKEQECVGTCHFVDYKIKCSMFIHNHELVEGIFGFSPPVSQLNIFGSDNTNRPIPKGTGFYLYARSSISKSSFRLANNVGIIDSGYRGNIGAYFDTTMEYAIIKKHQRLVQLCSPTLEPFYIQIIEDIAYLPGAITTRGEGGFGSTGLETNVSRLSMTDDMPSSLNEQYARGSGGTGLGIPDPLSIINRTLSPSSPPPPLPPPPPSPFTRSTALE
jgi:hypothetical protein